MNKAAQKLGKLGGKVKSEAKTKAARLNGKKGGRPRLLEQEATGVRQVDSKNTV